MSSKLSVCVCGGDDIALHNESGVFLLCVVLNRLLLCRLFQSRFVSNLFVSECAGELRALIITVASCLSRRPGR